MVYSWSVLDTPMHTVLHLLNMKFPACAARTSMHSPASRTLQLDIIVEQSHLLSRLERRQSNIRASIASECIAKRTVPTAASLARHREVHLRKVVILQLRHAADLVLSGGSGRRPASGVGLGGAVRAAVQVRERSIGGATLCGVLFSNARGEAACAVLACASAALARAGVALGRWGSLASDVSRLVGI